MAIREFTYGGEPLLRGNMNFQQITRNRNLGILVAMAVCFCAVHLITTEYVSSSRSAGQVLCWLPGTQNQMTEKKTDSLPTHESLDIERHSKVFTWSDLSYTISKGKGKQTHQILQDIDGWIRPQQLTAVMVSFPKRCASIYEADLG